MRVIIKREQETLKGVLGIGKEVLYVLKCCVELTADEKDVVERAGAENQWVLKVTVGKSQVPDLKIGELIRGVRFEATDLNKILNDQTALIIMCRRLKLMMTFLQGLGSDESYDM
ncbi:MAG: hypothetical protein LC754_15715 [Acidobacteria bacterium]|nr:hypothetical protein [Acidobacteriota bacterium]